MRRSGGHEEIKDGLIVGRKLTICLTAKLYDVVVYYKWMKPAGQAAVRRRHAIFYDRAWSPVMANAFKVTISFPLAT